jgi:Kef-type K+ transport system membrane component KefB
MAQGSRLSYRTLLAYGLMIVGAVCLFFVIRFLGQGLVAPDAATVKPATAAAHAPSDVLLHVLLALVVVIVVARLFGAFFRRINQPPVIGEVLAGIFLGPSLLGRLAPDVSAVLLPPVIAPFLGILSQVGVILYMFLVGLELDTKLLRQRTHTSVAISHASIVAPFLLGALLALWLYPLLSSSDVSFTVFALFMGVSMSVTAFPVLARILTDRQMQKTRLGTIALACAAVDDVTAWCLLAFVVSVVNAEPGRIFLTLALTAAYIAAVLIAVRPAAAWLAERHARRGRLQQDMLAIVCVALLLSALTTEGIGIHALFGAFFLGAVVPHDSTLARDLADKLEDVVVVLLLPAFFAFTGMRTEIGLVNGLDQWLLCAVIIFVASLGKFGGTAIAARLTGLDWNQAASLGVLMNTRGLMELIVLNIGLDLGVLSPTLFAMLVLMALVTTLATTPILHLLAREEVGQRAWESETT